MTEDQLAFLKSSLDQVVVLDTVHGERLLVQILIVVDEGETPDLFCIEVEPAGTGFLPRQGATHSILLADIVSVQPPAPLPLP
jgi:hypothetical protein